MGIMEDVFQMEAKIENMLGENSSQSEKGAVTWDRRLRASKATTQSQQQNGLENTQI